MKLDEIMIESRENEYSMDNIISPKHVTFLNGITIDDMIDEGEIDEGDTNIIVTGNGDLHQYNNAIILRDSSLDAIRPLYNEHLYTIYAKVLAFIKAAKKEKKIDKIDNIYINVGASPVISDPLNDEYLWLDIISILANESSVNLIVSSDVGVMSFDPVRAHGDEFEFTNIDEKKKRKNKKNKKKGKK